MLRHKTLTLAAVMVCLAIMPLYSTNVLAQGIPEVIQRLNNIQQTLNDQIIPKLDQCTQCPECPECTVGVPKTGQTIPYGPRDDGALQKGVPWPQPRFTDNDNGTVTDNLTGLIWLKDASCFGEQTWAEALSACNTLASPACGLADGSVAGDWRLPNLKELQSLLDFGQEGPALPPGHPFVGGIWIAGDHYWSSTTYLPHNDQAWYVEMYNGVTDAYGKTNIDLILPVRDAQ